MLESAGFEIERSSGVHVQPLGPGHPKPPRDLRRLRKAALQRVFARGTGNPSVSVLARPDPTVVTEPPSD
jgi:hypothetical protein